MSDWYVYQGRESKPLGPYTSELIASAIVSKRLSPHTWIAARGGKWLRASEVPVIASLLKSASQTIGMASPPSLPSSPPSPSVAPSSPGHSSLRVVPMKEGQQQPTSFGSTVMMVKDDEITTTPNFASTMLMWVKEEEIQAAFGTKTMIVSDDEIELSDNGPSIPPPAKTSLPPPLPTTDARRVQPPILPGDGKHVDEDIKVQGAATQRGLPNPPSSAPPPPPNKKSFQ